MAHACSDAGTEARLEGPPAPQRGRRRAEAPGGDVSLAPPRMFQPATDGGEGEANPAVAPRASAGTPTGEGSELKGPQVTERSTAPPAQTPGCATTPDSLL
eukprot:4167870-Pyramimonas_sp.AAC.1